MWLRLSRKMLDSPPITSLRASKRATCRCLGFNALPFAALAPGARPGDTTPHSVANSSSSWVLRPAWECARQGTAVIELALPRVHHRVPWASNAVCAQAPGSEAGRVGDAHCAWHSEGHSRGGSDHNKLRGRRREPMACCDSNARRRAAFGNRRRPGGRRREGRRAEGGRPVFSFASSCWGRSRGRFCAAGGQRSALGPSGSASRRASRGAWPYCWERQASGRAAARISRI